MKADTLLKKYTFWHDIENEFSKNIDFSKTSISEVAEKSRQDGYTNSDENKELYEYIFQFYAYNELLASYRDKNNGIIDNDDLKIYEDYQNFVNDFSKRIFSFILFACTAEARHSLYVSNGENSDSFSDDYITTIHEKYCDESFSADTKDYIYNNFVEYIKENWEEDTVKQFNENPLNFTSAFSDFVYNNYSIPDDLPSDFVNNFNNDYHSEEKKLQQCLEYFSSYYKDEIKDMNNFKDFVQFLHEVNEVGRDGDGGSLQRALVREETLEISNISHFSTEEFFRYLSIFFQYNFEDGYGGMPWSDIAKHALLFSKGEINAEMFIDRALSLEHNNGQMFNKNFIFNDNNSSNSIYMFYERDGYLQYHHKSIQMTDFILHLQNCSSVLSVSHFLNQNFSQLTAGLDLQNMKSLHKDFNQEHLNLVEHNFSNCQDFANTITSLKPMLEIAKKIDYAIPSFDYANLCVVLAQKMNNKRSYRSNTLDSIENNPSYNSLLSDIVNNKYRLVEPTTSKKSIYIKKPVFNLYNLNQSTSKTLTKEMIGGKAFGLVDLINKGFNVPKALVFDTKTCLSYLDNPKFFQKKYNEINSQIIDYLVDEYNQPLLVSVRSGAPVSMPGMMDSILNVGIDDTTYEKLCKIHTKEMIHDCSLSFMQQFCSSKLGIEVNFPKNLYKALDKFTEILIKNDIACDRRNMFPLSKEAQVKLSVEAVFDSWNSPRAFAWRNEKNISHDMGTAATVQKMVFGNRNDKSLTTVIFSRDCITGKPDIMGEYLVKAQGEDLVSGKRTPLPISHLKNTNPKIYQEIEYIAKVLEAEKKAIQDLEITVENGKVYVLQMRNAVVSPEAQLALAKELDINFLDIIQTKHLIGESKVDTETLPEYNGLAASPGLISGVVVKNLYDIDLYKSLNKPLIFFSNQALPEHAPIMIATQAFITEFGGATSHAAILARSMEKPCIVGIGKQNIESGTVLTIDAIEGKIWKDELPIKINQDSAIALADKIIEENNIELDTNSSSNTFVVKSWLSDLSSFNIIDKAKDNKHTMFLNLAQKTALALKMDSIKKSKTI